MTRGRKKTRRARRAAGVFVRTLLAAGSVFLFCRGYLWWLDTSDVFSVNEITVQGSDLLTKDEVLELGGIDGSARLWDVDLTAAVRGIESFPFIASASVTRRFPDGISITVEEKTPVALLNFEGTLYAVDEESLVLPSRPGRMYDLPVISGRFLGGIQVGSRAGGELVSAGLRILDEIMRLKPSLYCNISEIVVGDGREVLVYTKDSGTPVRMGAGEYTQKIRCLAAILERLKKEGTLNETKYIDLRFQDQVVVGMRT